MGDGSFRQRLVLGGADRVKLETSVANTWPALHWDRRRLACPVAVKVFSNKSSVHRDGAGGTPAAPVKSPCDPRLTADP